MFESFLAVPLHFTIEFLGFLVAIGGALLAATRPDLIPGPVSNRYSVALGFGVLALAQVLHGGAFFEGDGEAQVVAIRALAYALILVGVVGGLRPGVAILGIGISEPLLFAPAGASLLVAVAAFAAARTDSRRAWNRLAGGMLLLAVAEFLTGAAPHEVFGGGSLDPAAFYAHWLKALGFLAVGSWLWGTVRSSIRVRFVASFAALLVAVVLALATSLTAVISNSVETGELDRTRTQAQEAADSIGLDEPRDLYRGVRTIAEFPDLQESLAEGDDPKTLADAIAGLNLFETDFIIVDPAGPALPAFFGKGPSIKVDVSGSASPLSLTEGLKTGLLGSDVLSSVAGARTSDAAAADRVRDIETQKPYVVVMAAAEVKFGPKTVGVIAFGRWVDYNMMAGLADPLGAEASVSVISSGRVVASIFPKSTRSDIEISEGIEADLNLTGSAAGKLSLGDDSYFNGFAQIEASGEVIGTVVISSRASIVGPTRAGVNRLLFVAAMLVGGVALALAWVSGRRITQPIQDLTATAQLVREGDLKAQAPVAGPDEVGQLGETFNEMTASLLKMTGDLREAAREEHSLRTRIETIIQSMADGLVAIDADLNVLAFNREAEHLTGIPAGEAMDRPISDVLEGVNSQGEPVELPIHGLSEGSMSGIFLKSRDRDPIPIAITSAVLRTEDRKIAGAVAVIRDMTREREVERMKTEFLSNISHELRTPLTPIKGYAEILSRKEVPPERVKQFVKGILESTSRLERIVELLVDFAAMEAGRMAPRTKHVDVAEMLNDLVASWKERSPEHEIVAELSVGLPDVLGDERLLRRSIEEVLDNAIKFSPAGGKISLEAKEVARVNGGPELVEITITDEGIGITPDDMTKIFSDFQQLDGSETRTFGGLGLGLAFVRRIAQAHEGDVRVESEVDQGTAFTILIPAAAEQAAPED